jgi:hypothetical protein
LEIKESTNQYRHGLEESEDESCLSDLIPSSLESEYEEVKFEVRKKILKENRSS